jgi:C-terminal processing protease CtpA/Prc
LRENPPFNFFSYFTAVKKSITSILLLLLVVVLYSCKTTATAKYNVNQKIPPAALQEDIRLLRKILEANHPSLYWYTPKDSLDAFFDQTLQQLTDSLTEAQFKNRVAFLLSKIRCGHTAVRNSNAYSKTDFSRLPQFPLALKTWGDSMVVLGSAFRNDSIFKRGTIITGINGYTNRQLMDTMYNFLSTDGYADHFKSQVISSNFPLWYRNIFGLQAKYTIHYIDSAGQTQTTSIKNYDPVTDTLNKRTITRVPEKRTKKQIKQSRLLAKRNVAIDTTLRTAYMNLNSFSGGKLKRFYRSTFKTLQQEGITDLVIDLRQNGGGNMMNSTRLVRYISKQRYTIADTVAAITRTFHYGKYIKPKFFYWCNLNFGSKKRSDGRIHFGYFERKQFKPYRKHHFNGATYIITGAYSFSAATLFTAALQGQDSVTVVGEETGGGAYGNSAVHLPQITLPHTKLRVILPMYRLVIDHTQPKTGRGIVPHIMVPPNSAYIKRGVDPKVETVRRLIREKRKV